MPAPIFVVAAQFAKRVVFRRLLRIALVALPFAVVGSVAVGLLVLMAFTTRDDSDSDTVTSGRCTTLPKGDVSVAGLSPEQIGNAQTIVAVGRELQVPAYGWVVAVATAMQESSLTNLPSGHLDSVGLFQQRDSWGPRSARLNPEAAARMFYEGGAGGQKGLVDVNDFQALPVTAAAQQVQQSAFPDAYARWETLARQVVGSPEVLSAKCLASADYVGDGTPGARAVTAALRYVGTPYSWGGGGIGGPSLGFGPGSATVGFDCSSLVQYAYHEATGQLLPRVTDAQAASLPRVPDGGPLRAGDLLFFHSPGDPPGSYHHVGIYDGQGNMVHAPRTGKTVEVVHGVLANPYFKSQLALVVRPAANRPSLAGLEAPR